MLPARSLRSDTRASAAPLSIAASLRPSATRSRFSPLRHSPPISSHTPICPSQFLPQSRTGIVALRPPQTGRLPSPQTCPRPWARAVAQTQTPPPPAVLRISTFLPLFLLPARALARALVRFPLASRAAASP